MIQIGCSIALGIDDLSVLVDSDGCAGCMFLVPLCEQFVDLGSELCLRVVLTRGAIEKEEPSEESECTA